MMFEMKERRLPRSHNVRLEHHDGDTAVARFEDAAGLVWTIEDC